MLKLCFEAHRDDGKHWAVYDGTAWHLVKGFETSQITLRTVYNHAPAPGEPSGYLTTDGPFAVDIMPNGVAVVLGVDGPQH